MNNETRTPKLTYRLIFYLSGLVYAVLSYVIGTWVYELELASIESTRQSVKFWHCASSIMLAHPFTFITWMVSVTVISILLGYLFDREVKSRRRAEQLANIDGLTEVYNHRYFQDRLGIEIERASRYNRPLSLMMFDLDNFKDFNDRHGHQEGDKLLKWFVRMCESNSRTIDVIARYGGEEFVIILPETTSKDALVAANRIRQSIETEADKVFPDHSKVTVSAGIAALPDHGHTRYSLILAADSALYYAKRQGKNQCFIYKDEYSKGYEATPERLKGLLTDEDVDVLEALSAAIESKDKYSAGHSKAVSRYALKLGEELGLSDEEQESLRVASLLHDIGALGTPDSVRRKVGELGPEERKTMEHHPNIGSQILDKVRQLDSIVPGVKHHHERFDGQGYPNGLSGKDIPLNARIIALADAFDAMISDRPYRPAMSIEQALEEISRYAGSQFDPELVELFVSLIKKQLGQDQDEAA